MTVGPQALLWRVGSLLSLLLLWQDFICCAQKLDKSKGMLYPRPSPSRAIFELGGLWKFRADMSTTKDEGFNQKWFQKPLAMTGPVIDMPVPSSFNDITQDESLRSFIGWVWYEKQFYTPFTPGASRIVLRVESAHYHSIVWVNGNEAFSHVGGHLPFEGEISKYLVVGGPNRVTIAVNNTLLPTTLPPGDLNYDPEMANPWSQSHNFDFFNYAGIHRPVRLYTTPTSYVDDITVATSYNGSTGEVSYDVKVIGDQNQKIDVSLYDRNDTLITSASSLSGRLKVPDVKLWWPYTMYPEPAYLYTLVVSYENDSYRLPVGIRTVKVEGSNFKINNKTFYFHGLNKHEDADIRGKGLDMPLVMKDINLLKWLGVNAFRTSHYPYSEEIMELCDQHGIVVIDESPGVGIIKDAYMTDVSIEHHKDVMFELIRRDKNRPSVVMWSVANEPASGRAMAGIYFKSVFDYTRSLDSRPLTFAHTSGAGGATPQVDLVTGLCDVLCLNNYLGWYTDPGILSAIAPKMKTFIHLWADYYGKPVILSEYGAGTIAGFHADPPMMYTEDYQVALFKEHFKVFDELKSAGVLSGELVWNFADFMTQEEPTRAFGNRKGILTRQRQPKAVAYVLQERYLQLAYPHRCPA